MAEFIAGAVSEKLACLPAGEREQLVELVELFGKEGIDLENL
jgi:hypothetical protein